MSNDDLDRLLRDSLKSAGDRYDGIKSPQRKAAARARFLERYEKRRWVFPFTTAVAAAALAGVIAVGVYVVVDSPGAPPRERDSEIAAGQEAIVSFPVDGDPVDIGVRDTGVWVADAADGELARFDPATGDPVSSIAVGDPRSLSIGVGSVWVGDPTAGHLYQVDKKTDAVVGEPVTVGDPAPSMSISVGDEAVWVVIDGRLKMVDLETHEVTEVPGVARPVDVAANVGMVWVLDGAQGLVRLDPTTGETVGEPIPVQGLTGDVYSGAESVWVADRGDDTIVSVDPETGRLQDISRVRGTYLDMGFDSTAMWVLSRAGGTSGYLTPLDLTTGDPLREPLRLDGQPVDVATGAGAVWVALRGEDSVARVDPVSVIQEETETPEN